MEINETAVLDDRGFVQIKGNEAKEFLQNIVTNDLEKVTKQAYAMVSIYGLSSEVGNISYYDSSGQQSGFTKPYSEERNPEIFDLIEKGSSISNGELFAFFEKIIS